MLDEWKYFIVKKVYADHNDSKSVRHALGTLLESLPKEGKAINVGAGRTRLDSRVVNMEIEPGEGIDIVGSVERIPCANASYDLVIAQEVLEHVSAPDVAIKEIHRILKPSGVAYIQLPFIIGYHPCPGDYWRFTHQGIQKLVETAGFVVVSSGMSVGPAVGFYRILVEFMSTLTSALFSRLYKPAKFIFAVVFFPIKWLDPLLARSGEANRIAGGYFVVCRKNSAS